MLSFEFPAFLGLICWPCAGVVRDLEHTNKLKALLLLSCDKIHFFFVSKFTFWCGVEKPLPFGIAYD